MTWTEAHSYAPPFSPVFYGREGTLIAGEKVLLHTRKNPEGIELPLDDLPDGQKNAIDHFLYCIRTGTAPQGQTCPELCRDVQEVMEAGLRSATTGMEVQLPVEDHLFR